MQNNPFVILGVSENCSKEELQSAYERLHKKYAEERFLEGEQGAEAARMYQKVELAYQDALDMLQSNQTYSDGGFTENFDEVKSELKKGNLSGAQQLLDDMVNRGGDWHYWQAAVYYKKNWYDESRTQLKIALELDPNNAKYKETLDKVEKEQNSNNPFNDQKKQQQQEFNRTYSQQQQAAPNAGGCCDCCSSLICADCCCEMCGGDLISCC